MLSTVQFWIFTWYYHFGRAHPLPKTSLQATITDKKNKRNKQTINCYNQIQHTKEMQQIHTVIHKCNTNKQTKNETKMSLKVLVSIGPNIWDLLGIYGKLTISSSTLAIVWCQRFKTIIIIPINIIIATIIIIITIFMYQRTLIIASDVREVLVIQ